MKTKKIGVFAALTVVLLVSAALIASCVDALGSGGIVQKEEKTYIPPMPSAIGFLIEVEDFESARYITPDKTQFDAISKFSKREVYISGGDDGTGHNNLNWNGTTAIPVVEHANPYIVEVVGYNSDNVAVAYGKANPNVTVTALGGTALVTMKEIKPGDHAGINPGNGTLVLTLNNTTFAATSATVNIIPLNGGSNTFQTGDTVVIGVSPTTTFSLIPGYYRLELTVTKSGFQTVIYRELVLIDGGFTTTYAKTLSSVSNVHTVTYNFNDERPSANMTVTHDHNHGAVLLNQNGANPGVDPDYLNGAAVDPVRSFKGWYTLSDGGVLLTVGTTKILKPQTIYAQWQGATITINFTFSYTSTPGLKAVTFEVTDNNDDNAVIPNTNWTFTQGNPPNIKITAILDSPSGGTVSYNWSYDYGETSLGTGASINVNFGSGDVHTLLGTHVFKVIGMDAGLPADGDDPAIPSAAFEGIITFTVE